MNTSTAILTQADNSAAQATTLPTPLQARLQSLALAAVLTVSMLSGVNLLAVGDVGAAPQMAQASTARG